MKQNADSITVKQSGLILLQSAPQGVDHDDVKHDLEQVCCPWVYQSDNVIIY